MCQGTTEISSFILLVLPDPQESEVPNNILASIMMVMWFLIQNEQRSERGPGVVDRKALGRLVGSAREK